MTLEDRARLKELERLGAIDQELINGLTAQIEELEIKRHDARKRVLAGKDETLEILTREKDRLEREVTK